jgi:hypothetical protein
MPGWLTWASGLRGRKLSSEIEAALEKLGVRHYDEDLLDQDHEWLRQRFPRDAKRILKSAYFRNVVWQTLERIRAATHPSQQPEFYHKRGLIRGMWYYFKPRIDHLPEFKGDHAGRINEALQAMVEAGVLSYTDFQFRDDAANNRRLGVDNPHILLAAEKDGFLTLMLSLYEKYGCHVFTHGGTPGLLSTNYFVSELVEAGIDLTQEFVCFSIVDFDPKGTVIMRTFTEQLQTCGVRNFKTFRQYPGRPKPDLYFDIVKPQALPPGVSYLDVRYNLPKIEQKKWWGEETGGPNGRGDYKHGIESDEFRTEHLHALVEQAVTPHLRVSSAAVQKRFSLRAISQALSDFASWKMIHGQGRPR